ncbi:MAG: hypothetical protein MSC43_05795 [Clostridiales bacterium]|nr:hypothetical protein [Clostridiales bacterium]MDD7432385.1 hypothetical protein [Clostridiales bacterium]MDY3061301.1 hypothetical protein [Eubacteriales bacterium]
MIKSNDKLDETWVIADMNVDGMRTSVWDLSGRGVRQKKAPRSGRTIAAEGQGEPPWSREERKSLLLGSLGASLLLIGLCFLVFALFLYLCLHFWMRV